MSENEKIEQTAPAKAGKDEKPQKPEKKKPGFFARIGKWLRELRSELKKVQWPTPRQTAANTGTVILCVLIVGVFIWIFDALAGGVISAIISLFKG